MRTFILSVLAFFSISLMQAQTPTPTNSIDTAIVYAYLNECSLTTDNDSKIWCTKVSLERIILENYSYPTLSDTSTFVNREKYRLKIYVSAAGKIDSISISGCSNVQVKEAVLQAIPKDKLVFIPAKGKSGSAVPFVIEQTLRSFIFSNSARKHMLGTPQKPAEMSEDEQEQYQGKVLQGYHMN